MQQGQKSRQPLKENAIVVFLNIENYSEPFDVFLSPSNPEMCNQCVT